MLVLLVAVSAPLSAQTLGACDAGFNGDAGNTQGNALRISPNQRYSGCLTDAIDEHDWYEFNVGSGSMVIEVFVATDPGATTGVELWRPGAATDPVATGGGAPGSGVIQVSAGGFDGDWTLHVSSETSARYIFTLVVRFENDNNLGKDVIDSTVHDAGERIDEGKTTSDGILVRGNLTAGDSGDLYKITVPSGENIILASLQSPPGAGFGLSLLQAPPSPTSVPLVPVPKRGEGFATVFVQQVVPGSVWGVRVANNDARTSGGPYVLTVRTFSETGTEWQQPDAGQGKQAPPDNSDPDNPPLEISRTLHVGSLKNTATPGSPSDTFDAYRLVGIEQGRTIRVGVSAFTDNPLEQPALLLRLWDPSDVLRFAVSPCTSAGGFSYTSNFAGTGSWWLQVVEVAGVSGQPCGALVSPNRDGPYAVWWDLQDAQDVGGEDAPSTKDGAPVAPTTPLSTGTVDRSDRIDTYKIGQNQIPQGGVIRAGAFAPNPGLNFKLRILDSTGSQVAATTTSSGAGRVYYAAPQAGIHYFQLESSGDSAQPLPEGSYRFFVHSGPNEPPLPVTLSTPSDADVGRTSVKLAWTESPDGDFSRYEIHRSKTSTFAPSSSTLGATITNRGQITTTLGGLEAGQTYTFLVRVVDSSGSSADSNRVTKQLKSGPLGNTAPTLSGGAVEPQEAPPGTEFTYRVTYRDAEGDPPTQRKLFIDNVPVDMTTTGTNYAAGVQYTYKRTFTAEGGHVFRFEFSDGEFDVRDPPVTGNHEGPKVSGPTNRPPSATARASPNEGEAPLEVQFDVEASDPDGDSLSYSWDFDTSNGIQQDSNSKNPKHTYTQPKEYTARVAVTDSKGATTVSFVDVNVKSPSNRPPVAQPEAMPSTGAAPLTVQFDARASDPDGSVVKYEWDFDSADGIQIEATSPRPTHTYTRAGSFVATVTVEDDDGTRASGTVTVTVTTAENRPPTITISAEPSGGNAPLHVVFTADVVDPDGDSVTVRWDFDTSNGIQTDATGLTVEATYGTAGTYTVMAIATDAKGATATATTDVEVLSPTASTGVVFIVADPKDGKSPLTVKFEADTSQLTVAASSYLWDFGDGSPVEGSRNPTHTYSDAGTYTVSLIVTDQNGAQYESTIDIVVSKKSPGPELLAFSLAIGVALWFGMRRRNRR